VPKATTMAATGAPAIPLAKRISPVTWAPTAAAPTTAASGPTPMTAAAATQAASIATAAALAGC